MLRQLPRQAPVDMHVHDLSFSDIVCGVCVVDNSVRTNRVHADDVRGEAVVNDTSSEYFNSSGESGTRMKLESRDLMDTSASITNDDIFPSIWNTIGNPKSKCKMPRIERPITRNNQATGSKHFPIESVDKECEQVVPVDNRLHRGGGERRTAQSLAGSKTSIPNFSTAKSTHY